jgi:beta-glucosidase
VIHRYKSRLITQVLKFVRHAQESGIPFEAKEGTIDTPEVHALLQEAADASIVLLKNENQVLPVSPATGLRIAVIGSNAKTPPYAGGGSANLLPTYTITPLQAIERVAAEMNGSVSWEMGVDTARWTPLLTDFLSLPDRMEDASIVRAEFYDVEYVLLSDSNSHKLKPDSPWAESTKKPLFVKENNSAFTYFIDGIDKSVPVRGYISVRPLPYFPLSSLAQYISRYVR